MPQESNVTVIRNDGRDRAVVFVHGFTGKRDDTWDRFPSLLGMSIRDWDIFTLGYATTLLPDVTGIWSADPDLPILAMLLSTHLRIAPLQRYRSLALVAHSMGGLVVQKSLVDDSEAASRVRTVILFGTPSAGLRKPSWIGFWKRQLKNMALNSQFISELRTDWERMYGENAPFELLVVAGASDQFVPPDSSLKPFEKRCQRVVDGNHLDIVKPANPDAMSLKLVVAALNAQGPLQPDASAKLRVAAEQFSPEAEQLVADIESSASALSPKQIVDAALALDRAGRRAESIALLERHQERDTDVKGTLAGRIKRLWFETEQREYGERALSLYNEGLNAAQSSDQMYYHAINVAFLKFVFANDTAAARHFAKLALKHANPPDEDMWRVATVAEAHLYLGDIGQAVANYRKLLTLNVEDWKLRSTSLQASIVAANLNNRPLAEELENIFTPGAKRVNRIFISYSHKNIDWLERLKIMIAPYLRQAEVELDPWDDTQISPGGHWNIEIRRALEKAGVAVALVSPDFLASTFIMEQELPVMIRAAEVGGLQLLWLYISAAGWEETPFARFQAAHDTHIALDQRPVPEQNEILKSVAKKIKAAGLLDTARFKNSNEITS